MVVVIEEVLVVILVAKLEHCKGRMGVVMVILAAGPQHIGGFGTSNNGVVMVGMAASVKMVIMMWWPPWWWW